MINALHERAQAFARAARESGVQASDPALNFYGDAWNVNFPGGIVAFKSGQVVVAARLEFGGDIDDNALIDVVKAILP